VLPKGSFGLEVFRDNGPDGGFLPYDTSPSMTSTGAILACDHVCLAHDHYLVVLDDTHNLRYGSRPQAHRA
jgi:hypothetical protein